MCDILWGPPEKQCVTQRNNIDREKKIRSIPFHWLFTFLKAAGGRYNT